MELTAGQITDSKFNFRILPKRRPQGKKTLKRLDVAKLKQDKIVEELSVELDSKLQNLQLKGASLEDGLKETIYTTAWFAPGPHTVEKPRLV